MADDITKLAFEIEQKGAADVEKSFQNIEAGIASALKEYKQFSIDGRKSSRELEKNFAGVQKSLGYLEKGITKASEEYGGMFHGGQMKRQKRRIQDIRKEMDGLTKVMMSGNKEQQKMAVERMKTLKEAADVEAKTTVQVFQSHQKEFDKLVNMKKKSLGELSQEAAKGSATAIQQLMGGDVQGLAQTLGGGIQGAGQQAQKAGFDRDMAGKAGAGAQGAQMTQMLKTFGKVAGPIAMIAGSIGMLVKLFLDLDSRVKEINKSMLKNVSLVELASSNYGSFADQAADAGIALKEFNRTVMTDMNLRMLGLDPDEMGSILDTMHQQGLLLSDLRRQGVGYADALETAQVAALNLGVDASETAGLIGTLANVTAVSFSEASESLTQIISFSKEAGVSTQRFFNTVQSVVGEMGLYNYRIEETAALFSRLSNIMDAENAEQFTQELSTAFKNASALERTTTVVVNGLGTVADMADRTQERLQKALDPNIMKDAFAELGEAELFEALGMEGAMRQLTSSQQDILQSIVGDVDTATGQQLQRYSRILDANRNDVMEMQGLLSDFALGDQIALQIGELENKLGMPLENMNSVLAGSQGVSEDQLRMMQSMKSELSGDLGRLQQIASEDPESFQELAEQMGYSVSLAEIQNGEIESYTDLLGMMTDDKQEEMVEAQQEQKTLAERSAELQRSMLDTLKYKLMDLVQGIYEAILGVYDAIVNSRFFGGSDDEKTRVATLRQDAADRRRLSELERERDTAMEGGNTIQAQRASAEISRIQERQQRNRMTREVAGRGLTGADATAYRAGMGTDEFTRKVGVGSDIASALGRTGGAPSSFVYGDEEVGNFRGMEDDNFGELERIMVNGRWLEGSEMEEHLAQIAQMSTARTEVDEEIASQVEAGNFTAANTEATLEETRRVLEEKGISISDGALRTLVNMQMQAQARTSAFQALTEEHGYNAGAAQRLLDMVNDGNWQGVADAHGGAGNIPEGFMDSVNKYGLQSAGDARIVTGGVPMLDLQPGDIIVDQEALAQTMAGGKGTYVPELLNRSGGGGSSARNAAGNIMHAYFTIYGDNGEIRQKILKVIQEWERTRSSN